MHAAPGTLGPAKAVQGDRQHWSASIFTDARGHDGGCGAGRQIEMGTLRARYDVNWRRQGDGPTPYKPAPRASSASHTQARTPHHLILAHSPAIPMEAPKPAMTTTTQPQAVQMSECLSECSMASRIRTNGTYTALWSRWLIVECGAGDAWRLGPLVPAPIAQASLTGDHWALGLAWGIDDATAVSLSLSTTLTNAGLLSRRNEPAPARGADAGVPAPQGEPSPWRRRRQGLLPRPLRVLHLLRGLQGLLRVFCGHRLCVSTFSSPAEHGLTHCTGCPCEMCC